MLQKVENNQRTPTYAELFTEYLSDITLEVEGIKVKAIRDDTEGIMEHVTKINNALLSIIDTKLSLAEECQRLSN